MRKMVGWLGGIAAVFLGCGASPAGPPAPSVPTSPAAIAPPTPDGAVRGAPPRAAGDPFAVSGTLHEEMLAPITYDPIATPLAAAPKGLVAPAASCAAFASRKSQGKDAVKRACEDSFGALDAALGEPDKAKRDASLVELEGCADLPQGIVRALRVENADAGCGDVLAAPLVGRPGPLSEVQHALMGLALASRLSRTVARAGSPAMVPPFNKDRVLVFIKGPLKTWIVEQAKLIEELATQSSRLRGYGRAVAAVEAGLADLRFVEIVRGVPIPDAFAKDAELKSIYESQLDQMLDPRKERGRDAVLVGLKDLAAIGVVRDARVAHAREVLGRLYAGRRIDALDALLLPPLASPAGAVDGAHKLALRLPTFYAGLVLDAKAVSDRDGVLALSTNGYPLPIRTRMKSASMPDDVAVIVARARLELGRTYWRALDFDEAALAAKAAGGDKARSREAELLLAVALALRGGPDDAAQMMRKPPPDGLGIGDLAALDAVTKGGGPYAGLAAFDGAWIKRVSAPRAASADHWRDVAARFKKAESLLADPSQKTSAGDAAREAEAIAAEAK